MPHPWESKRKRIPRPLDRRIKLSDTDRTEIKRMYAAGVSIRAIAREYAGRCSRRMIQFVIFPDRYDAAADRAKEKKNWKVYYDKKTRNQYMRKHRKYKGQLNAEGELIDGRLLDNQR